MLDALKCINAKVNWKANYSTLNAFLPPSRLQSIRCISPLAIGNRNPTVVMHQSVEAAYG
jgi:hypothetical protein